jgi:hypothetical protein
MPRSRFPLFAGIDLTAGTVSGHDQDQLHAIFGGYFPWMAGRFKLKRMSLSANVLG